MEIAVPGDVGRLFIEVFVTGDEPLPLWNMRWVSAGQEDTPLTAHDYRKKSSVTA